jgi:tRNA G26 N,N-dimethylase Trm1
MACSAQDKTQTSGKAGSAEPMAAAAEGSVHVIDPLWIGAASREKCIVNSMLA